LREKEKGVGHVVPQVRKFGLQFLGHPAQGGPEEGFPESPRQEKNEEGTRTQGIEKRYVPKGFAQNQGEESSQEGQEKGRGKQEKELESKEDLQTEGYDSEKPRQAVIMLDYAFFHRRIQSWFRIIVYSTCTLRST
jgi:hypothetical protein